MATTAVGLVNAALAMLSAGPVTDLTDTTDEHAKKANALYTETRDETLEAAPWNEAQVRTTILAYTEPAAMLTPGAITGTAVTFTLSAGVLVAGDVGKELREANGGTGRATITAVATGGASAVADITSDWLSTAAIAADSWRLYNATPAWGGGETFTIPSGLLRLRHVHAVTCPVTTGPLFCWCARLFECPCLRWNREGVNLIAEADEVAVLYTQQVTDVSLMTAELQAAIIHHLAAKLAFGVTSTLGAADLFWKLYAGKIKKAIGVNAGEGTPIVKRASSLIDVRR